MRPFTGTFPGKIDAKRRVCIPAAFRTILREGAAEGPVSVYARPSHKFACVEFWPTEVFEALNAGLAQMPVFGDDNDDMSMALFGDACTVESDREGRILLPDWAGDHAGLSDTVTFIGQGQFFSLWQPAVAEERRRAARARVLAGGVTLPVVLK